MSARRLAALALLVLTAACSPPANAPTTGVSRAALSSTVVLTMDPVAIPHAAKDVYKCQDFPNPFGGVDAAIVASTSTMGAIPAYASFHAILHEQTIHLAPDGSKGPVYDCPSAGAQFHPIVHDAHVATRAVTYPDGVGRAVKANQNFRLMVHYVNTGTATTPSVSLSMDYVPESDVSTLAAEYVLNATSIVVPTGSSALGFDYVMPQDATLYSAIGQMGCHGLSASLSVAGSVVYSTASWQAPVHTDFTVPIALLSGDTVHVDCSYANSGAPLTFGESALKNEQCQVHGAFTTALDNGGTGIAPVAQ